MPVIKRLVCVLLVWGLVVVALLLDLEVSTVARLELAMNLHRIDCDCETSNLRRFVASSIPRLLPPSLILPLLSLLRPGSRVFRLEECGCYRSLAPRNPDQE